MTRPTTAGHVRSFQGARCLAIFLTLAGSLVSLSAQSVILAPPQEPLLAPAQRKMAPPPPLSRPPAGPETPYRLGGVFVLHPRANYEHMRADGLPIRGQAQRGESDIGTFSAGLALDIGDKWSLDYSPSWVNYSNKALADSTEHAVQLSGAFSGQNWAINFAQSYDKSNKVLVETAQQTDRENWATELSGNLRYSPKLQLGFTGSIHERYSSLSTRQRTWSARGLATYSVSDHLSLTLTPSYTYTEVIDAPDYYGEGLTASVNWRPLEKVSLSLGGGVNSRRTQSSSGLEDTTPQVNFALAYQPFTTTSVNFSYSRSASASFFRSQTTENRTLSVGFAQRLLERLYFSANYEKNRRDYESLLSTVAVTREDDVEALSLRLSTRLLQRLSVALVYQDSRNRSNLAAFTFSSTQYGIELGYRY